MHIVNITELRQHLPAYLKKVEAGEEIRVTSRGRVIARILPEKDRAEAAQVRLDALRNRGFIHGDIVGPLEEIDWSGDADHL